MLKIETLVVGQLKTNCYLLWDAGSYEALIIDPGDDGDFIIGKINQLNLKPLAIVATHAHFDHILAVTELKLALNIPFYLDQKDEFLLSRMQSSALHFTGVKVDPPPTVDGYLNDLENLFLDKNLITVIPTPGHTPGSVTLYSKETHAAFVGDLIFKDGFLGRTDFVYSKDEDLHESIEKILNLPGETAIYSGHGEITTVTQLKAKNTGVL